MTVRQWMTAQVVTMHKEASVQEALKLMKKHSVRHLPVVEENGRLCGWVTDADLRGVLIASMLEELTLEDVMVRDPYTAYPSMPLEDAARLIVKKRIGGMPVVENEQLVGVVTVIDILAAFISLTGVLSDSSRVDVKVQSSAPPLDEITRLIKKHDAEVISICQFIKTEDQVPVYSLRLKKCDLEPILDDFKKVGIEVVSIVS